MARQGLTSMISFERALGALLVLNLLDAALTSVWVSTGITGEGNPMMAAAIALGYGPFVLGKVALVGLGAWSLWSLRRHLVARVAVLPMTLLYCVVLGNHLGIGARVVGLVERGLFFGGQLPG